MGNGGAGENEWNRARDGNGGGGDGGNGGGGGGTGSSITPGSTSNKTYQITFDVRKTGTATTISSKAYSYGSEYTFTFPEYSDSNTDISFLGWKLTNYAKSTVSGSALTTAVSKRYQAGDSVTLDKSTWGDISFTAITEEVGGIKDDDIDDMTYNSGDQASTYHSYQVRVCLDGELTISKGAILLGGKFVSPGTEGTYSLLDTKSEEKNIVIGGHAVGSVTADSTATINYETIKVTVTGKAPKTLTLSGSGAPSLAYTDGYSYSSVRLTESDKGSYNIYVDGEDTGKTASYGATTSVAYHTDHVTVATGSIVVNSVELCDSDGNFISMNGSGNSYSYTALESSTKYTVYVNGEATETTTDFSTDHNIGVDFRRYMTTVQTYLDGALQDMGTVLFGDTRMIRFGTGTYALVTTTADAAAVTIDGKNAVSSLTPGATRAVNYYRLNYSMSGTASATETGTLPMDENYYLSGTKATLLANSGLTNGGKTFAGWTVNGTLYPSGQAVVMSTVSTAYATWKATDFSTASEHFTMTLKPSDFVYNAESQIPQITITNAGKTLTEGTDYTLSYRNTNSDAGRGTENTINAGTVTVTATGKNDYAGTLTATYRIAQHKLIAHGIIAVDRTYDGTLAVQIMAEDATLDGKCGTDDVGLNVSSTGKLYSPTAKKDKPVIIDAAQLKGTTASNYDLQPIDSVTVNIAKKPLTADMFTIASVQYDSTAKTPAVTASDMQMVSGSKVDILAASDYSYTYTDNIHAGSGKAVIRAGYSYTDAYGNTVSSDEGNYSGTVTQTFTINPAPLTLSATPASSVYGAAIADVSGNYTLTSGTIFTDEDKEKLAIKGVTTVKAGYDVGKYESTVKVSYNKDSDYEVATLSADYTVTTADTLKVTSSGYTGVYDAAPHSITVKPESYRTDESIAVYYSTEKELTANNYTDGSTTNPVFTDAGTYTVYFYARSKNYTGTAGSNTVMIGKAPLTISANKHSIIYGQDTADIAAENNYSNISVDGLMGSDTAASVLTGSISYTSNDYVKYENAGTYTLIPHGLNASNYDIAYQSGSLIVEPKTVEFSWPSATAFTYTGAEQGIMPTVSGLVSNDGVTVSCSGNTAVHAGSYTAKIEGLTGAKAMNYTFASTDASITKEWKIGKASNSWLTALSISGWTEGENANVPVAQAKYGTLSAISYSYKKSTDTEEAYSDIVPAASGSYDVKAMVPATADYEELESTPVEFTIAAKPGEGEQTKKTVYATVESQTITYGESVKEVTVHYTDAEGKAVDTSELGTLTGELRYTTYYDSNTKERCSAGTYVLLAGGQTSDICNMIYAAGTLTVEPKELTLTWPETELSYNGTSQSVYADVAGTINDDKVSVSDYTGNAETETGTYTAAATGLGGAEAGNYKLPSNAVHNWKIVKADNEFIITPSISGWTYGEKASTPIGTAKYGTVTFQYQEAKEGIADWSIFNPVTEEVPTDAGTYRLIATVAAEDNYNVLTSSTTEFTIAKAEVTITASDASSEYGQEVKSPLTFRTAVMKGKLTSADITALNVTLTTDAAAGQNVGSYPITVGYTANENCNVSTVNGNYIITKVEIAAVVNAVSAVYDGKAHGIEAPVITAGGSKVTDAEVHYSTVPLTSQNYGSAETVSPTRTDAGSEPVYYYITGDNYVPITGNANLEVTKKSVNVTAKNTTVIYGEAGKNDGMICSGFVGKDTAESLKLEPSYTYRDRSGSTYIEGSPVGKYDIAVSGLTATNYSFVYTAGTMTVTKKPLTDAMFSLAGDIFTYDGTEKKMPVTGTDGTNLLKTADYTVTYSDNIHAGTNTAKVTMTAADSGNYTGTVTKAFSINPCKITYTAKPATSVYNEDLAALDFAVASGTLAEGDDLHAKAVTTVKKGYEAGTYKGAVSVSCNANTDYDVTVETADYIVTKASLTVTELPCNAVYDGAEHKAEVTVKTGRLLTYATLYYSAQKTVDASNYTDMATVMPTFKTAGTHHVYYYAVCDNYEPASGTVDVVISKAQLNVTAPERSIVYGESTDTVLNALGKDDLIFTGFVNNETAADAIKDGDIPKFATDYRQYMPARNYSITLSGLASDNYELIYKPGTLTVNKKTVTFTWSSITELSYNGNEQGIEAAVTGKAQSADDVTAVCTENRKTAAGDYTAKVTGLTGAAADDYEISAEEETTAQEWTIRKASNHFTIAPFINDWTEGKSAAIPVAAAKYGTPVFTYSDTQDGTYTANVPAEAGNFYLKAAVAETANYEGIEQTVAFKVNTRDDAIKTITIQAKDAEVTYGDLYTPTFTEDSYTVTGLSDGQSLADVADGNGTIRTDYTKESGAGTYLLVLGDLTAKNGYEISFIPGKLTVGKKEVHLIWSADSFVYSGAAQSVYAIVQSSDLYAGDSITVTGYEYNETSKIRNIATDVGIYTAHAISFIGSNAENYTISGNDANHSWSIIKADSGSETVNRFTVQPSITGWSYGSSASEPIGRAKYGTVKYTYSSTENGVYTADKPQTAGNWYMKATVLGTDNYEQIESQPVGFTISKSHVNIVADDISSAYGSALSKLTYAQNGTVKAGDDLGVKLSTTAVSTSKPGNYPITVTYTANANYEIETVGGTYFITTSTSKLNVTASGAYLVYDGASHGISVSVKGSDGQNVRGATIYYSENVLNDKNYGSGSTASPMMTNAGKKTVYYYVASDLYAPVTGSKDIEIVQKRVTVTAKDASITYGDAPVNNGVSYTAFAGSETAESLSLTPEYDISYAQYGDAGNYTITPKGLSTEGNYKFTYVKGTLTVAKKPVTFIWSQKNFIYDGTEKKVTATVKGLVGEDDITAATYTDNKKINAGTYTAAVTGLAGIKASSYVINESETTAKHAWNIAGGTNYFTVTPAIADWMYGNTPAAPLGTAAYGSVKFLYCDTANGNYTQTIPVKPGTYYMKARVEASDNYPLLESVSVRFKIAKGKIRVAVDDITGKEGDTIQDLTYDVDGAVAAGDSFDVSLSTTATAESPAGNYPITAVVSADDALYEVSIVDGTYHITDIDISITADGVNVPYDGKTHSIAVKAAVEGDETVKIYYSETKITDTSDLEYKADTTSPERNHPCSLMVYYYVVCDSQVFTGSKMLIITKAPLTVTAKDKEINQGDEPANNGVSYSGFAQGETEAVLTGTLNYTYTYSKGMTDGHYEIKPAGLSSNDYTITYASGTLTVWPEQQETTISGIGAENGVYNAEPHKGYSGSPTALGGDMTEKDFTIIYKDADGAILADGAPTSAGDYSVTISIPASNLYWKSSVTYNFTIAKKSLTVQAQNQAILAGDKFVGMEPVYSGFEGTDTTDTVISQKGTVSVENADLSTAGTAVIKVKTKGTIADTASGNYSFADTTIDGTLTIIKKADTTSDGDGTGKGIKLDENSGIVQTAVVKTGDLPTTTLDTDLDVAMVKKLLTENEVIAVEEGENALIYLVMSETNEADEDEMNLIKQKVTSLLANNNSLVGLCFDFTMFKKVGDNAPDKISVTGTKTTISIVLPAELLNTDTTKVRTYYIVYAHNGEVKEIQPSYSDGVLTFSADEFSTYSIAYVDTVKSSGGGSNSGTGTTSSGNTDTDSSDGTGAGNAQNAGLTASKAVVPKTTANPASVIPESSTTDKQTDVESPKTAENDKNSKQNKKEKTEKTDKIGTADQSDSGKSDQSGTPDGDNATEDTESATEAPILEKTDTPVADIVEEISRESEKQFADALNAIQILDPAIKAGPYVQVPEDQRKAVNEDGTVTFTVNVPEDLQAKGRTFYLMAVDNNGNVYVLKNESMENGTITATGDSDVTYQIIYEDNSVALASMISENGTLEGADGKAITVSTNHCFWHWILLLLGAGGAVLEIIIRKKKKVVLIVPLLDLALLILCLVLGWCLWDIPAFIIGLLLILFGFMHGQKMVRQKNSNG